MVRITWHRNANPGLLRSGSILSAWYEHGTVLGDRVRDFHESLPSSEGQVKKSLHSLLNEL